MIDTAFERRSAPWEKEALPCVGCGEPVKMGAATTDREGHWHPACEQAAWEASGLGARPVVAPFRAAWIAAKARWRAWAAERRGRPTPRELSRFSRIYREQS